MRVRAEGDEVEWDSDKIIERDYAAYLAHLDEQVCQSSWWPSGLAFPGPNLRTVELVTGPTVDRLLGAVRGYYYPAVRTETCRAGRHRRESGELGTPTGAPDAVADPE